MENKTLTARELREGKFLLRAPLPAIALLTLLFWGLGGGSSVAEGGRALAQGFNMRLPSAHVPSIVKLDKMGYYALASRDSVNERQRVRMEASYAKVLGLDSGRAPDSMVAAVRAKLANVKRVLGRADGLGGRPVGLSGRPVGLLGRLVDRSGRPVDRSGRLVDPSSRFGLPGRLLSDRAGRVANTSAAPGRDADLVASPGLQQLEKIITNLQHAEGGNSEIAGLTTVIEKLAALQSPRRDTVQRRLTAAVKQPGLSVRALPYADDTVRGGFDSLAIEALVPEEQVLVSGEELRLELVRDILLDGRRISAGTPVYGVANLSGERLRISISAIVWQDRIFPVNLQVEDEDGLTGIHIPGAPVTDAVRESMSSEAGAIGPTVLPSGLAGQALDAGVSLGRSLVGKRIRAVRVTVPAGYRVLLHQQNVTL